MHGYAMDKEDLQDRLRRIEGQVRGLQRMVDEDQYCIDILTQVNSVWRRCARSAWACSTTTSATACARASSRAGRRRSRSSWAPSRGSRGGERDDGAARASRSSSTSRG